LAKRELQHPNACPLCDQEDETIQHVLVSCVFTKQVWLVILQKLGLAALVPQSSTTPFCSWWHDVIRNIANDRKKGQNSLIILVAWETSKHRNACV
jgi:hypothetical protein